VLPVLLALAIPLARAVLGPPAARAADPPPVQSASETAYVNGYMRARAEKDSLFRYGGDSPIPAAQQAAFAGLRYFPVALRYRIEGTLQVYGRPRLIQIPATGDTSATVERYGRFAGSWAGTSFSLETYRLAQTDQLEVFFTDATTGEESYGGGRYAAVQALGGGRYVIDFNGAYNPYCAYSHLYSCPLPPPQNRLPFRVEAGEMGYGPDLASREP